MARAWPPNFGSQQNRDWFASSVSSLLLSQLPSSNKILFKKIMQNISCRHRLRHHREPPTTSPKQPHPTKDSPDHFHPRLCPSTLSSHRKMTSPAPSPQHTLQIRPFPLKKDRSGTTTSPPFARPVECTEGWRRLCPGPCVLYIWKRRGGWKIVRVRWERCQVGAVSGIWCLCVRREIQLRF